MTTMTDPTTTGESLSAMMEAGAREGDKHYFGEITLVDDWDCALVKGAGKVPFDPAQHTSRLIALKIQLTCTKADGSTYTIDQDDITSGTKHKVTLPSLDTLGIKVRPQLRGLVGQFAEVVRVPTGRTYLAKQGAQAGQQVPETAMKFLRLFASREDCQAAERAFYTPKNGDGPAPTRNVPQPIEQPAIDQAARAALLATLPILWKASGEQVVAFYQILDGNPAYASAGITREADEVITLTGDTPF